MSDTLTEDKWIERVLGVSNPIAIKPVKQVKVAKKSKVSTKVSSGVKLGEGKESSGKTISLDDEVTDLKELTLGTKPVTIVKMKNGTVSYTAPPPPVKEITFSGGGAKGAALPGALKALEDNHVLDGVTTITGSSVGAMTASLVAAGITAEDFKTVSNDDFVTSQITEGKKTPGILGGALKNLVTGQEDNALKGEGLEKLLAHVLDASLNKRVSDYDEQCKKDGTQPNPVVFQVLQNMGKDGPTFDDLRVLSKVIPQIKEAVITGTYTTEFETKKVNDKEEKGDKLKGGNDRGQLYIFSADTEPKMPVSVAVHASASFPFAFKPVVITLSSGLTVRFVDGGAMNNTPTTKSIGAERELDPMPEGRGMTFVFQGSEKKDKDLLEGITKPKQGKGVRFKDWLIGSSNGAAEYGKNSNLVLRPEEIVIVPTKVKVPKSKDQKKRTVKSSTLGFFQGAKDKEVLQNQAEKNTDEQIKREKAPKTREFASDSQMFVSIPLTDLKELAKTGYPDADKAVDFREAVAVEISTLIDNVKKARAKDNDSITKVLDDTDVKSSLDRLLSLDGGDLDFKGYIAREMNKGPLDGVMTLLKNKKPPRDDAKASLIITEALKCKSMADNILKQFVYPQLAREDAPSVLTKKPTTGTNTLLLMEQMLRAATTLKDISNALQVGIKHFEKKKEPLIGFKKGYKQFAEDLKQYEVA
jgi:exoenzyme U